MNVTIQEERVNRLLHRTELKCVIESGSSTPTREEVIRQIAAKKGVKESLVIVDSIRQEYGKKCSSAYVKVYESEKALKAIEPEHKVERARKALVPKEEKKEEAPPAEEKKKETQEKEEAPKEGE